MKKLFAISVLFLLALAGSVVADDRDGEDSNLCPYELTPANGEARILFGSCNIPNVFTPGMSLVQLQPRFCSPDTPLADMCACCLGCVNIGGTLDYDCVNKAGCLANPANNCG
jgi:hypothetical protein